jgi:hypothetical protein
MTALQGFSHFHAGDFARFKPPFERFKDDESARRELVSRLLDVIHGCGLRKFGAVVKKADLVKAKAALGFATDQTVDEYVLCCRSSVDDLYAFAKSENIGSVATVFEKGDPEDRLRKHFASHGFPDPDFAWAKEHYIKGKRQREFIGLQAAGWLAWEYYADWCRVLGLSDQTPSEHGRAPFRAFEEMPGHIKITFQRNPFDGILTQGR